MMSKLRTLQRWSRVFDGSVSVWRAIRLLRSGRHGGDEAIDSALPLRVKGLRFPVYARPGTDDLQVFLEIFEQGEYRSASELIAPPVRTVVDLGSNVGLSIAYFASIFPDATLIGIEPSRQNLAVANRTLETLISAGRVSLEHGFIGVRSRSAVIGRGGAGGSNELFLKEPSAEPASEAVAVWTMPVLMEKHRIGAIDLLKCDIEGGEQELFSDCGNWIGSVRAMVIELHDGRSGDWIVQQCRQGGADFELLKITPKTPGISLGWLRRRS